MSVTVLQTRNQTHRLKDFPKVKLRMIKVKLKLRVLHMIRINAFSVNVHMKHYTEHKDYWQSDLSEGKSTKDYFTDTWKKSKNISTFVFQHYLSNKDMEQLVTIIFWIVIHISSMAVSEQSVCVIFSQIMLLFDWFYISCFCGKGRMVGEV